MYRRATSPVLAFTCLGLLMASAPSGPIPATRRPPR